MSEDTLVNYCDNECLVNYKDFYCLSSNVTNSKSTLSRTSLLAIILAMCIICGRIVTSNAETPGSSIWQQHPAPRLTNYDERTNFHNNSEIIPSFGKVPNTIEVMPGQTVVLSCIVNNLGDRTVSWIRTVDLQILTSGSITFTGDNRFSTEPTDDILSNCWGLMIRNVRYTDTGQYECQLNTSPKLKINVTLIVREPQLMDRPFVGTTIDGARQQEIKRGSTITLTCRAIISTINENEPNKISFAMKEGTHRTKRVIWSVNDTPITMQIKRGGINVYTDWNFGEVVSNLTLSSVTESDQGVYKCSIDDIGSDEVVVQVMADIKTSGFNDASAAQMGSSLDMLNMCLAFVCVILSQT
ncbi:junctional adhesion molecule-like [Bradysia coprophila]|uniref:junctional adhesion molecule-like n=1 Tax=Bradysia coprophila TaxID=38358 RepID=UPI00187DC63D|nr:junctional adhesion molecule-like [Bradysia coprophila]